MSEPRAHPPSVAGESVAGEPVTLADLRRRAEILRVVAALRGRVRERVVGEAVPRSREMRDSRRECRYGVLTVAQIAAARAVGQLDRPPHTPLPPIGVLASRRAPHSALS